MQRIKPNILKHLANILASVPVHEGLANTTFAQDFEGTAIVDITINGRSRHRVIPEGRYFMSPAECPFGLWSSRIAPSLEISGSPTARASKLADASIVGRRLRRIGPTPRSYSGSIDPDFDRQVRLTRTPCMLETESIRWRWCCAQLTGR
jgi:hypothetical protein